MFRSTATTVAAYLAHLPAERRATVADAIADVIATTPIDKYIAGAEAVRKRKR